MIFIILFKFLFVLLPVLISVAFFTLLERKILSLVGIRVGPNKVSVGGILQPLGDAGKLSSKQPNQLSNFSSFFYYTSAFFMLLSSLLIWSCFNSEPTPFSLKFSLLACLLVLGLNSLNSILTGWSSFSKFSLMGSIRTVSQLISYEACLYFCLFLQVFVYFSFSLYHYTFYAPQISFIFFPLIFFIWVPCFLAELNRTPYDFSEGESELVSGFNTEFGSSSFTLIFLAEYSMIIFFCWLSCFLFFLESSIFFLVLCFFVIWIRSVLPRYRFDKLMSLAWKTFIPFLTFMFCVLGFSLF